MEIKIIKEKDDPEGILRASAGGTTEIGFYLTYRGDLQDVKEMLEFLIQQINELQDQGKQST